tara:strand:+ start:19518 stop:19685 length:168 start_codon:yes stop_codon:yes gene_type:complete
MLFLLKSKTIIFNGLLILGGLYLPDLSDSMRTVLVTTGASNIGLRFKTDKPLKEK